jgi:2-succinyl-5-enolpyruvyl-6-hydroxy-3-cyclohexene-1-carboxylate synthase
MRQDGMFSNYVKSSHSLVCDPSTENALWNNDRTVNHAIDETTLDNKGPVHINIPMHEPLYHTTPIEEYQAPKIVKTLRRRNILSEETQSEIRRLWQSFDKVLVIVGQHTRSAEFDAAIGKLASINKVVVLTETTSNVVADGVYRSIDRLIDSMNQEEYGIFAPDLVISCGGALVSKKLRFMLREMHLSGHWHVDASDDYIDTYQSLTMNIPMMLEELVPLLIESSQANDQSQWKERWVDREETTKAAHDDYLKSCSWSDLFVLNLIHEKAPFGLWHVANSTPVRYTQLFETRRDLTYRANRGVSGIDGCTSTAMGAAYITDQLVTLVTGDIAFFYDSNAFWHNHVPSNLRVIMINNEGGNIFRYVKGPLQTKQFEQHFEAHHKTSAQGIAQAYGVKYERVINEKELKGVLEKIYMPSFNETIIVEVLTPREKNVDILKDYFNSIKNAVHVNLT